MIDDTVGMSTRHQPAAAPVQASSDCDVVIVGAGPAGLHAAGILAVAGLNVVVVEASASPGGRVATRVVDGYILDRGFQVLDVGHPAVADALDLTALDLHYYDAGLMVRHDKQMRDHSVQSTLALIADPLRHPQRLSSFFASGLVDVPSVASMLRWMSPQLRAGEAYPRLRGQGDVSLDYALTEAGASGSLRRCLEEFFRALFGEEPGRMSNDFVRGLMWAYMASKQALPARGIGAVAVYLTHVAKACGTTFRFNSPVVSITRDDVAPTVTVATGETIRARVVIVATDGDAAAGLLGQRTRPAGGMTTWWCTTRTLPTNKRLVGIDIDYGGPIAATTVVSNVNRAAAPAGHHLVACIAPLVSGRHITDEEALKHAGHIWGVSTSDWEILARDDIAHARTLQLPGHTPLPPSIDGGVTACGEWCHTGSLHGALTSAADTASAVLDHLARAARVTD